MDRADLFGARRAGTSKSQPSVRSRLSETNDLWETRYGLLGCLSYDGITVYVRPPSSESFPITLFLEFTVSSPSFPKS